MCKLNVNKFYDAQISYRIWKCIKFATICIDNFENSALIYLKGLSQEMNGVYYYTFLIALFKYNNLRGIKQIF